MSSQNHDHPHGHKCNASAGKRVPVTILTGFLGSGKTTLLNHILQDQSHGMKFAIIENEFGAVNIDADLVTMKEESTEEIVEMINGCICCNVRGDLIPVIKKLLLRKDDFDGILIETTGMADPAPVIQTFLLDEEISKAVEIDGIVTVVDAKHVIPHLHEEKEEDVVNETEQQIAFADRILLNKIDLINNIEKSNVRAEIRTVNKTAEIIETEKSVVDPKRLIGIKGFDLQRVLEFDPDLLEEPNAVDESIIQEEEDTCEYGCCDGPKCCDEEPVKQSSMQKKKRKHDTRISSIAFQVNEDIDVGKLNEMLGELLGEKSKQLYRFKGVLSVKGKEEKYVLQGVHMLVTAGYMQSARWGLNEKRQSKFVFIGVDLDHKELSALFEGCKASPLRFKVGDLVMANAGTWAKGRIMKTWNEGNPYRIKLDNGKEVWAPADSDDYCQKRVE